MNRFEEFLGKPSMPVKNVVEKGAIRKFADAIGDPNPLYRDEAYASATKYKSIIAPPTFSRTFDYGSIQGFELQREGLIHGEQVFTYYRPIRLGDILDCSSTLVRVYTRTGKLGVMTFLVFEYTARSEAGEMVVKETTTVIYRGDDDS